MFWNVLSQWRNQNLFECDIDDRNITSTFAFEGIQVVCFKLTLQQYVKEFNRFQKVHLKDNLALDNAHFDMIST
jgi:hypothetical protein